MLRDLWMVLVGAASAWALTSAVRHDWMPLGAFLLVAVGSLVVVRRGYFGVEERATCRHGNRVVDGTDAFRRARLEIVRDEVRR